MSNESGENKNISLSKNNIIKEVNRNEITENEIDINNNKFPEQKDKNEVIDKEKKSSFKIIIMNKMLFVLWCIYFGRRRHIKNILLDEANKIIQDKLDIINIFKKIKKCIKKKDLEQNYLIIIL